MMLDGGGACGARGLGWVGDPAEHGARGQIERGSELLDHRRQAVGVDIGQNH